MAGYETCWCTLFRAIEKFSRLFFTIIAKTKHFSHYSGKATLPGNKRRF